MSLESWLAEQGVIIGFTAHDPRLNLEQPHYGPGSRTIAMGLKLEHREDVRLPDNRSLKEVSWSMYLVEATDVADVSEKENNIGALFCFEERSRDDDFRPEECHIEAGLNRDIFNALLSAIQAGRLPDRVSVTVHGLEYGWEPDGSGKIWDVKALKRAPVTNLSFGIRLTASKSES